MSDWFGVVFPLYLEVDEASHSGSVVDCLDCTLLPGFLLVVFPLKSLKFVLLSPTIGHNQSARWTQTEEKFPTRVALTTT